MTVGYYRIIGWLKVDDSKGFNAKPPEELHTGTSRNRMRVMYKKYCYKAEDPDLIKVMYHYGDRDPKDRTYDFRFPSLNYLRKRSRSRGVS